MMSNAFTQYFTVVELEFGFVHTPVSYSLSVIFAILSIGIWIACAILFDSFLLLLISEIRE